MSSCKQNCLIAVKVIYTVVIVAILIGVVFAAFIMKGQWNIFGLGFADIGVYGLIIFVFLIFQQIFSVANNNWWVSKLIRKANHIKKTPVTNIQVVGYRQDPKLFRSCLTSLSKQDYSNIGQIIVGIDGIQQNDLKMQDVFEQVFPMGLFIKLQKTFFEMTEEQRKAVKAVTENHSRVCIAQPHRGKRDIMYTCFHSHNDSTQLIALTDSDTMFEEDTITSLVQVMVGHDEYRVEENIKRKDKCYRSQVKQCGAVTGDVGIWNKQNYLSYLSALRYWFAFNVERAADSYFGVVNCVSGPLGLYKLNVLQDISHDWISQTFMGERCTFGDDRALSNRVLQLGLSIFYTPYARCQTDTPAQLLRWIPQQTRWCKSFYRQFFFNIKSFYKHSVWMSAELVFQFFYPFFIIITLVWYVTYSIDLLLIVFSFIVIMGTIRGLFGFVRTFKLQFLHYSIYVFLYILFLIPCKLWALVTIWNNQWGTSSRFIRYRNIIKALHAIIWAVGFILYIGFFIIKYIVIDKSEYRPQTLYVAVACLAFIVLLIIHWNVWGTYFLVPQVEEDLQQKYCEDKEHNLKKKLQHIATESNLTKSNGFGNTQEGDFASNIATGKFTSPNEEDEQNGIGSERKMQVQKQQQSQPNTQQKAREDRVFREIKNNQQQQNIRHKQPSQQKPQLPKLMKIPFNVKKK